MKLLFDQNLSSDGLIERLDDLWPGSCHVRDPSLGLIDADNKTNDHEIWDYARVHGFVIATTDSDFHTLSRKLGHPPKVVWIRPGNLKPQEIVRMLHEKHHDLLAFHKSDEGLFELKAVADRG